MLAGIGIGLRQPIAGALFESAPDALRWLEIHPENYVDRGGRYARLLAAAEERWPLLTHGLTMGFGSARPFAADALRKLAGLVERLACPWHSDHLCIASVDGVYLHDLLPLPPSDRAIDVASARIAEARAALGVPIAIEPISYYARPPGSALDEAAFLAALLEAADAKLLLDVNNVYVNAMNFGFDPRAFIDALPLSRVVQLHVAGHAVRADGLRIDTHAEPICEAVYALFGYTMRKLARPIPVLLERDDGFPPFAELAAEVTRLDAIYRESLAHAGVAP
ncbi:MAG: DUF692 domain-containing protein [Polyangiales bacterium]